MRREVALPILMCGLLWGTASCSRTEPAAEKAAAPAAGEAAPDLAPGVRAQLDSANAAFKAGDYEAAHTYYRNVTELDAALSAGWFGVYMAEQKLGNQAAADSAIARARKEGGS